MKKIIISIAIITGIAIGSIALYTHYSNVNNINAQHKAITQVNGSIYKFKDLTELKSKSDTIVEVAGTGQYKNMDYKGVPAIISTVTVNQVFKGDKSLKEIKILQVANLDVPPQKGQRLLMFLRKDQENLPDHPYAVVGAGQGIYIITGTINNNNKLSNTSSNSGNVTLQPQAITNDNILKDLRGNYDYIKNTLSK